MHSLIHRVTTLWKASTVPYGCKKNKKEKKKERKIDIVPALKELTVYYGKTDKQLIDKTVRVTIEPCFMCCKDIPKEEINYASKK